MFMNDASPELAEEAGRHARRQANTPFADELPQEGWSEVATRSVIARQDRFFPAAFQRRLVRERLQIEPDEVDGGHLVIRTNPGAVFARLQEHLAGIAS
jgi:pimeloyl-ACP methyl ester carboxylesterase